jgi:hypothetical protein
MGGPGCAATQIQADTNKITYAEMSSRRRPFCPAPCGIQLPAFRNASVAQTSLCAPTFRRDIRRGGQCPPTPLRSSSSFLVLRNRNR